MGPDAGLIALVKQVVVDYPPLEFALVCAVIEQESGWNTWAWNPEPRYRWFWDVKKARPFRRPTPEEIAAEKPPSDFPCLAGDPDQEWWAQQASWGLMQIMGAVAREYGLKAPYLTALCHPSMNIRYGCFYLRELLLGKNGDVRATLLRWNGGGDPNYPDKVLKRKPTYEAMKEQSK